MIAYADGKGFFELDDEITLRDFFAAHIMQGFVQGLVHIDKNDGEKTSETTAMMAYMFADEMLKARGKNVEE